MNSLIDIQSFVKSCEKCGVPEHIKNSTFCGLDNDSLNRLQQWLPYLPLNNPEKNQQLLSVYKNYNKNFEEQISTDITDILNEEKINKSVESKTEKLRDEIDELSDQNHLLNNDLEKYKLKLIALTDQLSENRENKQYDYELLKSKIDKSHEGLINVYEKQIKQLNEHKDELQRKNEIYITDQLEMNKNKSSHATGKEGERDVKNKLEEDNEWDVIDVSEKSFMGDFQIKYKQFNICLDSKKYKTTVRPAEVDKLLHDISQNNYDCGVIISLDSYLNKPYEKTKFRKNIEFSKLGGIPVLFISKASNLLSSHFNSIIKLFCDEYVNNTGSDSNNINFHNIINSVQQQKKILEIIKNQIISDEKNIKKRYKHLDDLNKEIENTLKNTFNGDKNNLDNISNDDGEDLNDLDDIVDQMSGGSSNSNIEFNINPDISSDLDDELSEPCDTPVLENEYCDIEIIDFIAKFTDINDEPQRNSVRDIKKALIDYCKKNNYIKMESKFNTKQISNIIEEIGYISQIKPGKNYVGKQRRRHPAYDINLQKLLDK